ncbi:bacterial transcriptional activator domain-containing protein [Streptomyces sp. NPDC008122]|uniref:bacterial transcriptional activator domain-containing protein n=1 Tax=Streptomyces sp. NPDC008122 TaxID=3364810 RepID=UPI0036E5C29E
MRKNRCSAGTKTGCCRNGNAEAVAPARSRRAGLPPGSGRATCSRPGDRADERTRRTPLRESAHRAVVAVHLVEDNVNEAVRRYRAFRRLLREKLGVPPSTQFPGMLPPGRWRPPAGPSTAQRTDGEVMTLG